jgi:hypothetical protein
LQVAAIGIHAQDVAALDRGVQLLIGPDDDVLGADFAT